MTDLGAEARQFSVDAVELTLDADELAVDAVEPALDADDLALDAVEPALDPVETLRVHGNAVGHQADLVPEALGHDVEVALDVVGFLFRHDRPCGCGSIPRSRPAGFPESNVLGENGRNRTEVRHVHG